MCPEHGDHDLTESKPRRATSTIERENPQALPGMGVAPGEPGDWRNQANPISQNLGLKSTVSAGSPVMPFAHAAIGRWTVTREVRPNTRTLAQRRMEAIQICFQLGCPLCACWRPMHLGRRTASEMGRYPRSTNTLFPSEVEIAYRHGQDPADWPSKAIVLERDGLPPIDPLMGARYWPAVWAYWNRRYGLSHVEVSCLDGQENLDAL